MKTNAETCLQPEFPDFEKINFLIPQLEIAQFETFSICQPRLIII